MRYITFLITFLLMISVVTALDFDNAKTYDTVKKQAVIKNSFGLGSEIASVRLVSKQVEYVIAGNDRKVAEFEINLSQNNYEGFLNQMKLYDLNKGSREITRKVTYKSKVLTPRDYPIYSRICSNTEDYQNNKTDILDCKDEIIGTETRYEESWVELSSLNLEKGVVTIGVFTDVYWNDRVEWIPTLFGVEIPEWATWTAALNQDLQAYYDFNDFRDSNGQRHNLTTFGNNSVGVLNGLIGKAMNSTGVSGSITNFTNGTFMRINSTMGWSTNFWINTSFNSTSGGNYKNMYQFGNGSSFVRALGLNNKPYFSFLGSGVCNVDLDCGALCADINNSNWHMITNVLNSTAMTIYLDGSYKISVAIAGCNFNATSRSAMGAESGTTRLYPAMFDEWGIWNRSLSALEITQLYNGGLGITYGLIGVSYLNSPLSGTYILSPSAVTFNATCDAQQSSGKLRNATLYVWDSGSTIFNQTTQYINGSLNETIFTVNNLGIGNYKWNTECCTTIGCGFNSTNFTFGVGYVPIANTTNATTFETALESYYVNVSSDVSNPITNFNFYYNGTPYTPSVVIGANSSGRVSIDIPIEVGLKNVIWEVLFSGGQRINITSTQYVNATNFTLCASPLLVPFLNITFKNETVAQQSVTAYVSESSFSYWLGSGSIQKNYSYSTASETASYGFCASPASKSLNTLINFFRFANSYSEQRTYSPAVMTLSNGTTNVTLFLLPSTSGQFVTFQVVNMFNQPVSEVAIEVSRSGYGPIVTTSTSSSGTATIFLDPNFQYTLTASKVGYPTYTTTQAFTLTEYTITLGGGLVNAQDYTQGISARVQPAPFKILRNDTNVQFNLTLASNTYELQGYGFTLRNSSGDYLNGTSDISSTTGGTVSAWINTKHNQVITMEYFWVVNDTYQNVSLYTWSVSDIGSGSIRGFFKRFRAYTIDDPDGVGLFGMDRFGYVFLITAIVIILVGSFAYKSGIFQGADIFGGIIAITAIILNMLGVFTSPIIGILAGIYLISLIIWRIRG